MKKNYVIEREFKGWRIITRGAKGPIERVIDRIERFRDCNLPDQVRHICFETGSDIIITNKDWAELVSNGAVTPQYYSKLTLKKPC